MSASLIDKVSFKFNVHAVIFLTPTSLDIILVTLHLVVDRGVEKIILVLVTHPHWQV